MDDLTEFERRLSAGLEALVGPARAVDAAAITGTATQTGRTRTSAVGWLLGGRAIANPRLLYVGVGLVLLLVGVLGGFAAASLLNRPQPTAVVAPSTVPSTPPPSSGKWPDDPPFVAYWTRGARPRSEELWVSRLDGTDARRLTEDLGVLAWSADGRHLAIATTESWRLYFADVGDSVGPLVDSGVETGAADGCPGPSAALNPCQIEQIALAPDGRHVALTQDCLGGESCFNIAVVDLQTGRRTVLDATTTSGRQPLREVTWSRDSSKMAFARERDVRDATPESDIYLIDADGTNLRKLEVGGLSAIAPAFSPDGTTIAFTSHYWRPVEGGEPDEQAEETDVYTVGVDGNGLRRLTNDGHSTGPDWTADGRIRFYREPFPREPSGDNVPSLWMINADGSDETERPAPVIRTGITRIYPYGPLTGLLVQPEP